MSVEFIAGSVVVVQSHNCYSLDENEQEDEECIDHRGAIKGFQQGGTQLGRPSFPPRSLLLSVPFPANSECMTFIANHLFLSDYDTSLSLISYQDVDATSLVYHVWI